jgi:hypothetical protein
LSSECAYRTTEIGGRPVKYGLILSIPGQAHRQHGRVALIPSRENARISAETKDPSGGTTGRVKLYGRWGGWALAPNTTSMGRDDRSHIYSVAAGSPHVQRVRQFF